MARAGSPVLLGRLPDNPPRPTAGRQALLFTSGGPPLRTPCALSTTSVQHCPAFPASTGGRWFPSLQLLPQPPGCALLRSAEDAASCAPEAPDWHPARRDGGCSPGSGQARQLASVGSPMAVSTHAPGTPAPSPRKKLRSSSRDLICGGAAISPPGAGLTWMPSSSLLTHQYVSASTLRSTSAGTRDTSATSAASSSADRGRDTRVTQGTGHRPPAGQAVTSQVPLCCSSRGVQTAAHVRSSTRPQIHRKHGDTF